MLFLVLALYNLYRENMSATVYYCLTQRCPEQHSDWLSAVRSSTPIDPVLSGTALQLTQCSVDTTVSQSVLSFEFKNSKWFFYVLKISQYACIFVFIQHWALSGKALSGTARPNFSATKVFRPKIFGPKGARPKLFLNVFFGLAPHGR